MLNFCFTAGFVVDEESIVEDVGSASNNADTGCATSNVEIGYVMSTASQRSRLQTMNMQRQQVEEETMVHLHSYMVI